MISVISEKSVFSTSPNQTAVSYKGVCYQWVLTVYFLKILFIKLLSGYLWEVARASPRLVQGHNSEKAPDMVPDVSRTGIVANFL